MGKKIVPEDLLFKVQDVLGRKIRSTKSYWKKIKEVKHTELRFGIPEVENTLKQPDEVRISITVKQFFCTHRHRINMIYLSLQSRY